MVEVFNMYAPAEVIKQNIVWLLVVKCNFSCVRGERLLVSTGHLVHMLAVVLLFRLVQQIQHLLYDGSQGTAQVLPTVGLPYGGHVNERRPPMAQVQRGVVGKVTKVSVRRDT